MPHSTLGHCNIISLERATDHVTFKGFNTTTHEQSGQRDVAIIAILVVTLRLYAYNPWRELELIAFATARILRPVQSRDGWLLLHLDGALVMLLATPIAISYPVPLAPLTLVLVLALAFIQVDPVPS